MLRPHGRKTNEEPFQADARAEKEEGEEPFQTSEPMQAKDS